MSTTTSTAPENWRMTDKARQRAHSMSYNPANPRRALSNVSINNSYPAIAPTSPQRLPSTPSRHPATPVRHQQPHQAQLATPGEPTAHAVRGSFTDPPVRRTFAHARAAPSGGGLYSRSLCYDQPRSATRGAGNVNLAGIDENALWDSRDEHGIPSYFDIDDEDDEHDASFSFSVPQPSLGEMILKDASESSFASNFSNSWYHHPNFQHHHRTTTGASLIARGDVLNPQHILGGNHSLNLTPFGQPLDEEGFHAYYSNVSARTQPSQSFNLDLNVYDKLNSQKTKDTIKTKQLPAYSHNVNHQHQQNHCQQHSGAYPAAYSQEYPAYTVPANRQATQAPAFQPAKPLSKPSQCTLCSRPSPTVVLHPCTHRICTSCLTSSLNIVGEKSMRCQVSGCGDEVADFELVPASSPALAGPLAPVARKAPAKQDADVKFDFDEDMVRSSTPRPSCALKHSDKEVIVLRIDNVPWDITPPALKSWLSLPAPILLRAHVMLDKKGKTASHAFVEIRGEEWARMVLRGEIADPAADPSSKPCAIGQRGVLGEGKRKRGVTITRAAVGELMSALFPSYRGTFVPATGEPQVTSGAAKWGLKTVGSMLMTSDEVKNLGSLIRAPTHFVKDPTLPIYALASILARYPSATARNGMDTAVRDELWSIAKQALEILRKQIATESCIPLQEDEHGDEKPKSNAEIAMSKDGASKVMKELLDAVHNGRVFTHEQIKSFCTDKAQNSLSSDDSIASTDASSFSESCLSSFRGEPDETCFEEFVSAKQDFEPSLVYDLDESSSILDAADLHQVSAPAIIPSSALCKNSRLHGLGLGYAKAVKSSIPTICGERAVSTGDILDAKPTSAGPTDSEIKGQVTAAAAAPSSDVDLNELAKEFGVEASIVQALALRLANGGGRNVTC